MNQDEGTDCDRWKQVLLCIRWSGKASLIRWHLSKGSREMQKWTLWISSGTARRTRELWQVWKPRCLGCLRNNKEANIAETQEAKGRIKRNSIKGLARGPNPPRSLGILFRLYLEKLEAWEQDWHDPTSF